MQYTLVLVYSDSYGSWNEMISLVLRVCIAYLWQLVDENFAIVNTNKPGSQAPKV